MRERLAGGPASGLGQTSPGLLAVEPVPRGVRCHHSESMAGSDRSVSWGLNIFRALPPPSWQDKPSSLEDLAESSSDLCDPRKLSLCRETLCWAWLGRDRLPAEQCPAHSSPSEVPAAAGPGSGAESEQLVATVWHEMLRKTPGLSQVGNTVI